MSQQYFLADSQNDCSNNPVEKSTCLIKTFGLVKSLKIYLFFRRNSACTWTRPRRPSPFATWKPWTLWRPFASAVTTSSRWSPPTKPNSSAKLKRHSFAIASPRFKCVTRLRLRHSFEIASTFEKLDNRLVSASANKLELQLRKNCPTKKTNS